MKCLLFIKIYIVFALAFNFFPAFGQDTSIAKLEATVADYKSKLEKATLTVGEKDILLRQLAFTYNQIGQLHFDKGNYETATKYFVHADLQTRKYHESQLIQKKEQLIEAEKNLLNYSKLTNQPAKDVATKGGRVVVSAILSDLIKEASYFDDTDSQKKYLERLSVVSQDMKDVSGEADAYEKLGALELRNNNSKEAFNFYDKAFDLRKTINKEWWTIDYIAYAHWQIGDYQKALDEFQKEINILRGILRTEISISTEVPGSADYTEKELEEVRKRRTFIATLDRLTVRSSIANALFNIAQIRSYQGKYGLASRALDELDKVIETFRSDKLTEQDATISAYLTLTIASNEAGSLRLKGRILEAQGLYKEALKNYTESAKIFSDLAAGEPLGAVASLRGRMAMLYLKEEKFSEARANVQEVLRLRSRLTQIEGTVYALILASRVERAAKEPAAALKFARQAKASAMQLNFGDDLLAEAFENEADNLLDKATDKTSLSLEQAIVGYKSAIETYRTMEVPPLLARSLNSLGFAFEKAGKLNEAEASYREAVKITETISSGFANEVESQAFQNKNETTEIYKRLVDLLVRQGKSEQALQFATKAQRQGLVEAIPKAEIKLNGKSAATLKAVAVAENKLAAATANLEKAKQESTSTSKNNLVTTLGAARQEYALAIKRLETEQPNLRFTVRPTDLLKLQSSLAINEAIISYLITDEKLYVFVVKKNAVAVRPVDVKQDSLRILIASARDGLENFAEDFYSLSYEPESAFKEEKNRANIKTNDKSGHYNKTLFPLKHAFTSLYSYLISPVADLLSTTETLKIIPNGDLFLLPFSALISPDDNKYLVQKYDLTFLTAGDLITSPTKTIKGNLVAFGNPKEAELEGALAEVQAIQKVYPSSRIYTDAAATKSQLFKLTSARILHLATHGHILTPLENSNIQLAHLPGNTEPDLSYGEIYALPLEATEMVVLSACKTALGTVSGTEIGVFIEAFRTKTNTIVASLWSVDDIATRELMTEFYKNLAIGKSRAGALRTAQLKLLKDGKTKNPLFWAAFVLYGDGGKLPALQRSQ